MTPLKEAIFNEVRNKHLGAEALNDDQLNKLLFHHQDGLRLSLKGFMVIKAIFTAYSFEIPDTLKSRHRRGMAAFTYPYYFTAKRLIIFSEGDAMIIKIHGGIEGFLETCCQLDTHQ